MLSTIFWVLLIVIVYTYIGYGVILTVLVKLKELVKNAELSTIDLKNLPSVTMFVAAYNEADIIEAKIENMLKVDYPSEKLQFVLVTDGSDDGTNIIAQNYSQIEVYHNDNRGGKIGAINRGMQFVDNEIVIFSDANAMLNKDAVKNIVRHYNNPKVGCVAGEKRIVIDVEDSANSVGEGFYWKYESYLKMMDYRLNTAVGAAGELFSIRTKLHDFVETDTILDDFVISMRSVERGYKIAYEPDAYASEKASFSVLEEMKRKVRISSGGFQSVIRLKSLLNLFKYPITGFQYISHRVLRWFVAPFALLLLIPVNLLLVFESGSPFFSLIFFGQFLFYLISLVGWFYEKKKVRIKLIFVPFYFSFMNYCVFLGLIRFLKGGQSVLWDKAKRA